MEEIKDILKKLRKDNGYNNMKNFCDVIGISFNTYQNYESGKRTPTVEILSKLADFYGVTTDYLLGREDRSKEKELVDLIGERYHLVSVSRGLVAMYIELEPKERKKLIEELKKVVCKDCDKSKP